MTYLRNSKSGYNLIGPNIKRIPRARTMRAKKPLNRSKQIAQLKHNQVKEPINNNNSKNKIKKTASRPKLMTHCHQI